MLLTKTMFFWSQVEVDHANGMDKVEMVATLMVEMVRL